MISNELVVLQKKQKAYIPVYMINKIYENFPSKKIEMKKSKITIELFDPKTGKTIRRFVFTDKEKYSKFLQDFDKKYPNADWRFVPKSYSLTELNLLIDTVIKQRGWTLGKLAEELGVSGEFMRNLRKGKISSYPLYEKLSKLYVEWIRH